MKFKISNRYLVQVLYDILATILGGIILSFLFFIFSDFIFTTPNLNGKWRVELHIAKTEYSKFRDLKLYYDVILFQKGDEIYGTGEKIMEIEGGEDTLKYIGKYRNRIEVQGYLDKNYLTKDKLIIHSIEEGRIRESSTFHDLIKFDENYMSGNFVTTVANSSGTTEWKRLVGK